MILSGIQILKEIENRSIVIQPFNINQLNPNSYNLKLHDELFVYRYRTLYADEKNETEKITIPKKGLILQPNKLYLGRTVEYTETHRFVPKIAGRSSIGRLGISVHVTAGFGDIGFCGYWTLEITCIHPVLIYPMKICQICYHTIDGEYEKYSGKYQNNKDIQSSKLYKEFSEKGGDLILQKVNGRKYEI